MYNSFNNLKAKRLSQVDTKMLYPLLRWASASIRDLSWCQEVNKYIFFLDPQITLHMLASGMKDTNVYVKYPKSSKEARDKSFELKKTLVMKYYKWSDQEFNHNKKVFDYIDWNQIATSLGCDNKERKLLGLREVKIEKVKQPKKKCGKSLFDF